MGTIEKSATFPVSAEKLWAVTGDPNRFGDWLSMHQKWKGDVPAEIKQGDTIVEVVSVMGMPNTITWTVEEYSPGESVTLAGTGMAGVKIAMTAAVTDHGDSSTLDLKTSFEGQMLVGAIGAAVEKAGLADLETSLATLAELLG
ncbi:SRPBCC family protein [Aeromicrobium sp.]|uniref:type II toxin-antitoxin system Rv0910 family toxin n=1 Tax=Aeromicrobium sp. TaxID=1871063 RepID=UPI0030C25BD4